MFLKTEIIKISQPLGTFYVASINADDLLKVVEPNPYRANIDGSYTGIQRPEDPKRLREISEYLSGVESAMPNSIIIAANTHSQLDEDSWQIKVEENKEYLMIPKDIINGSIIDGQHRLKGFQFISKEKRQNYNLLCSIYMGLPNPYQAYLFATININQKSVDKSLAYNLYGYNLDEENSISWSPEKAAVNIVRKLNRDEQTVFFQRITIAAENSELLFNENPKSKDWFVSTAALVDGILSLISSNPKKDRDKLQLYNLKDRVRSVLDTDNTTLRDFYLNDNDLFTFTCIKNFFNASNRILYKKGSYLFKTVGIQAQFKLLSEILKKYSLPQKDISENFFVQILQKCSSIDFSDNFFTASGLGKSRIQNALLLKLGFKKIEEIRNVKEWEDYKRLLSLD